MASGERKQGIAVLLSKEPIPPIGDELPSCLVTLDCENPAGSPLSMWEIRVAPSLIDPSAVPGTKVVVEYIERSPGRRRVIRIGRALTSSHEG